MADDMNHSFPRGHTLLATVVYLAHGVMLARAVKQRRARFYIVGAATTLALIVGLSRIYLGVHWTTDVLAGWCIGAVWACLLWLAARTLSAIGVLRRGADSGGAGADEAGARN
jgi:undecaprenyl-diphosphatase